MYALLFIILLQSQRPPDLSSPRTPEFSKPKSENVQLTPQAKTTTPHLSPESELQLGIEMGAQRETTSELKFKVAGLEDKREKIDRPDIDSLKKSREHGYWILSGISGAFAILVLMGKFLWGALVSKARQIIFGHPSNSTE